MTAPANPLRSLSSDSAYLASFLNQIPGPVLAVGHSYLICAGPRSSRSNHYFNCPSLIHRCIASGNLVQADREIQNGRGIKPTLKDLLQQFWQIGARGSQPTTQTNIFWKTSAEWESARFHVVLQQNQPSRRVEQRSHSD